MSQSKLDDLIAQAAAEVRDVEPPRAGASEALRHLRQSQKRMPIWTRSAVPALASIAVVVAVVIAALPRTSNASELLAIVNQRFSGVVHMTWTSNGRTTGQAYQLGSRTRWIQENGVEVLFETDRTTTRYPKGYMTIDRSRPSSSAPSPQVQEILRRDPQAKVTKIPGGFKVTGALTDGQEIKRAYELILLVDAQGRPAKHSIQIEGLGRSELTWDYGAEANAINLAPVPPDRVYDLDKQRADLLASMRTQSRTNQPIAAFEDEDGRIGVILAVDGERVPSWAPISVAGQAIQPEVLSFNHNDGFDPTGRVELEKPIKFGQGHYLLKTWKSPSTTKAPFTLQFPLWDGKKRPTGYPFAKTGSIPGAMLIEGPKVEVKSLTRTSSLIQLLCPENVPFFSEPATSAPTLPR